MEFFQQLAVLSPQKRAKEKIIEEKFPFVRGTFYMAGIHPWQAKAVASLGSAEPLFALLEELNAEKRIQGIGEMGLDFSLLHRESTKLQEEIFRIQLQLAKEWQLPVTLHAVACWQVIESLLKQEKPDIPLLFHRFSGSATLLHQLAKKYDCFFSFSPEIFQSGKKGLEALLQCPNERLLLEDEKATTKASSFSSYCDFFSQVAVHRQQSLLALKERVASNLISLFNPPSKET